MLLVGTHSRSRSGNTLRAPSSASWQLLADPRFAPSSAFSSPRARQLLGVWGQPPAHPPPAKPHSHSAGTGVSRPLPPKLQIVQAFAHLMAQEKAKPDRTDLTWGVRCTRCRGRLTGTVHGTAPPATPAAPTQPLANPGEQSCLGSLRRGQRERPAGQRNATGRGWIRPSCKQPGSFCKHPGPGAALGSQSCHRLGQSEQELAEAGCSANGHFIRWQQNGRGKERALQPQLPLLERPRSPACPAASRRIQPPPASRLPPLPGRSRNVSPECWRGDLSLPRVPEQIRFGARRKTSSKSAPEGDGSPAPKRTPTSSGHAEGQVHPKVTSGPNLTALPLPARRSPRVGCCDPALPQPLWLCPPRPCPLQPPAEAALTFAENPPLFSPNN